MNRRRFLTVSAQFGGLMMLHMAGVGCQSRTHDPPLKLAPLPYPKNALAPFISEITVDIHYGKHQAGYLSRTNRMVSGAQRGEVTLPGVVATARSTGDTALFNNAAQALNHELYWRSMAPGGGGAPYGAIADRIEKDLGGYRRFRSAVTSAAAEQFGSGWVWLVDTPEGLRVTRTSNADTPMADGVTVLMALDVWEHAYYLDYQNRRREYVEVFLDNLVNWEFAGQQLQG